MEKSLRAATEQGATAAAKIVREYAPNLPDVMLDEEMCEQAFLNLVLNACQAMGDAGGELAIRIASAESNGQQEVAVEIEDSGPGIPPDMKEQIFNPFVTTKKDGVGLGLAIVSKIVDAHGGSVKLIRGHGQKPGACFRVVIPVAGPVAHAASGVTTGASAGQTARSESAATARNESAGHVDS